MSITDYIQMHIQPLETCQGYQAICLAIDLSDRKLSVHQQGKVITTFDIAVGKPGWRTPTGNYYVFEMGRNVGWIDLFTGAPSEANPMLGAWIGYARFNDGVRVGFHPTNRPASVGQASSHGCNRMHLEDFNQLYDYIRATTTLVPVLVRQ